MSSDDRTPPPERHHFVTDLEFLAMVTHELAGPLNAVLLQAQLLARRLQGHAEVARADALIANTRRVVAVLQGFRRMLGRDAPAHRTIPWPELLRDALDRVEARIPAVDVASGEAPEVDVHSSLEDLGELLAQLVRYVGQPQPAGEPVWVSSAVRGDRLFVRVGQDEGEPRLGAGPALAPPFEDLGATRVEGIGLHLAWFLAMECGGTLHREGDGGPLDAVYFDLPLAEEQAPA